MGEGEAEQAQEEGADPGDGSAQGERHPGSLSLGPAG
jgi:hypothetical protein